MAQKMALLVVTLLVPALAQTQALSADPPAAGFLAENRGLVALLLLLLLLTGAIYLDKRHGSRYLTLLRQSGNVLLQRARQAARRMRQAARRMRQAVRRVRQVGQLKKEKLSGEEAIPTGKEMQTNIFDSEKTYVEADLSSIQEACTLEKRLEAVSSLQLEEETPKVDLREVFGQKDGQTSKRSKSKIRGRVQIKKSERESEDSQETKESKEGDSFEIAAEE